jgi:galactitol PTS system EIIB component
LKTIVVACGAGVATSTLIVDRIKDLLSRNNITANIIQCTLGDIQGKVDSADLIVTSMRIDKDYGKPVVLGISFLTGIGKEETEETILRYLT